MFNLTDLNLSYIIISPEEPGALPSDNNHICERLCSILYSKDYTVIPVKSYNEGMYDKSFIAITSADNDTLRFDAIWLMDKFYQPSVIAKYKGESNAVRIAYDGSEKPLGMNVYDSNLENKVYLYNGISFTFPELKRYYFPKRKEDLKSGMIVEYFNNNKWISKQVFSVDTEYEIMYKLLMKYEKVRVEYK